MTSPVAADSLPAVRLELRHEGLELWLMRVADVEPTQLDPSLLDRNERARAAQLARPDDRLRYLAAHVLLRQLLAAHLNLPPQDIAYLREPCPRCGAPHGRPAVDRPSRPLHFSLSRSAGLVLIGVAPTPIGVDVEILPSRETVAEVSGLLHAAERTEILSAAPSRRTQVFASIWTRKEAYLKAVGMGITADLAADHLGADEQTPTPPGWTVINVSVAAGYAAAAAISHHSAASETRLGDRLISFSAPQAVGGPSGNSANKGTTVAERMGRERLGLLDGSVVRYR